MKISLYFATAAVALMMIPMHADAAGRVGRAARLRMKKGGVTAGAASCARGSAGRPAGPARSRPMDRATRRLLPAVAAKGCSGAGCRASTTTKGADGAASRQSGSSYQSETRSASSSGSYRAIRTELYSGSRSSSGSGAAGSYQSDTTVSSETGAARSSTASGEWLCLR
ncbi:MAG: hypothetical protein R3C55_13125 [Parvularculaceae bacterium]